MEPGSEDGKKKWNKLGFFSFFENFMLMDECRCMQGFFNCFINFIYRESSNFSVVYAFKT